MLSGVGHHSLVEGPQGTLRAFYTVLVGINHHFERRTGMDPAGFDPDGNLFIAGPSETPQFAPGLRRNPERGNDAGWLNLSAGQPVTASSHTPGGAPIYTCDDNIRTWWEADAPGPQSLQIDLGRAYGVSATRTMFADRGLDYAAGRLPGAYRYRIEGSLDGNNWTVLLDKSENKIDQHIGYDTWATAPARQVRLSVLSAPNGFRIGVWEFTVFGKPDSRTPTR